MKHWPVALLIFTMQAGCTSLRAEWRRNPQFETQSVQRHYFLFGLATLEKPVRAHEVCATKKINGLEFKRTKTDLILTFLTVGLYSPDHIQIHCESQPTAVTTSAPRATVL